MPLGSKSNRQMRFSVDTAHITLDLVESSLRSSRQVSKRLYNEVETMLQQQKRSSRLNIGAALRPLIKSLNVDYG